MEGLLQLGEALIRWLVRGVVLLIWIFFPGVLLVPALQSVPDILAGAIAVGLSVVFWRGIRTWPAGRRLTDAVLAYVARD
jgi:hypothetical protein